MPRPKKSASPAKPAARPGRQPDPAASAAEIATNPPPPPSPAERFRLIQTVAFYKAEKDAFRKDPGVYWKEAETEINARFP